jgi:mannose-6-phosphate isomerase-like protein (cupin superfamily)
MSLEKINLADKFARFDFVKENATQQRIVGEVNDCYVKLSKFKGEFIWHQHENEDELFLIVKGKLTLRLRDKDIELKEGEFFIVPRGVEHLPLAEEEVHILLVEPKSTLNTGNIVGDRTVPVVERI